MWWLNEISNKKLLEKEVFDWMVWIKLCDLALYFNAVIFRKWKIQSSYEKVIRMILYKQLIKFET